jgi:hypothetical protein
MFEWLKGRKSAAPGSATPAPDLAALPQYAQEFEAAWDRTVRLGLSLPALRLRVRKDCVDLSKAMPVLLDYFARHDPSELIGQTLAIHFALLPRLIEATGVPFQLTIGWMVREGRVIFQHDEDTIRRFLREKSAAWAREGMPYHLWLTSPAYEILDVTFAMNLGWATTPEQCAKLVIYQSAHSPAENIYHPMIIGPDFFDRSGATASVAR